MSLEQILTYNVCDNCKRVNVSCEGQEGAFKIKCLTPDCGIKTKQFKSKEQAIADWNKINIAEFIPHYKSAKSLIKMADLKQIKLNADYSMGQLYLSDTLLNQHDLHDKLFVIPKIIGSYLKLEMMAVKIPGSYSCYYAGKIIEGSNVRKGARLRLMTPLNKMGLSQWKGIKYLNYVFDPKDNSLIIDFYDLIHSPENQKSEDGLAMAKKVYKKKKISHEE